MASINEKLNYINETKSLIKNKLNDLGSEIEDETTFRDYAEKIENLYEEWPKINDEDTTIHLENTKKGKMSLQLKGNTNQIITTGKNKLPIIEGTLTKYGITVTVSQNGKVSIKGTTTEAYVWVKISNGLAMRTGTPSPSNQRNWFNKTSLTNGIYTISLLDVDSITTYYTFSSDKTLLFNAHKDNPFTTLDLTETALSDIIIYLGGTGAVIDKEFYIQAVEGESADYNIEPYTEGEVAPNPNYPQNINIATGENQIVIENKNLLKLNNFQDNNYKNHTVYKNIGNYMDFICSYYVGRKINIGENYINQEMIETTDPTIKLKIKGLKPNTTYTISGDVSSNLSNAFIFGINYAEIPSKAVATFTTNGKGEKILTHFYTTNVAIGKYLNVTNIQLELGNSATDFNTYLQNSYLINLGNLELCKYGNDYQDYIYKYNNEWYIHKEMQKVTLTKNSLISEYNALCIYTPSDMLQSSSNIFVSSNYFITGRIASSSDNQDFNKIDNLGSQIRIKPNIEGVSSATTFKNWLDTHNTDIYYPLATSVNIKITDTTLINQLNTLEQAISYNNQTNISQINSSASFIINASALLKNSN